MPSHNNLVEQKHSNHIANLNIKKAIHTHSTQNVDNHLKNSDQTQGEHVSDDILEESNQILSEQTSADILEEGPENFGVGEKAVYPCHGVGTIENIQACSVGGSKQDFYVIKIHSTGAKVMVPTGSAKTVGLRSVISIAEVEKVYDILQSPSKKSTATWNRRFRTLNEKLNKGRLPDIAEVLRDLASLSADKVLSFGERKMLERASGMFVSEISVALNKDESDVQRDLNQRLFPILTK